MQRIKPLLKVHAVANYTKYVTVWPKLLKIAHTANFYRIGPWPFKLITTEWVHTSVYKVGVPNRKILSETSQYHTVAAGITFPECPISKCLIPKNLIPIPVPYSCSWDHIPRISHLKNVSSLIPIPVV